jgi:hypothetical protein
VLILGRPRENVRGDAAAPPQGMNASVGRAVLFLAVLVLAGVLRLTALDFGEGVPAAHPDEVGADLTLSALDRGEIFPPLVLYGGGYFYPLRAWTRAWAAVSRRLDRNGDGPRQVRLAARAWSAVLSTGTVALTWVVAGRVGGSAASLVAGGLVAVAPLAVREAHFAKADTAAAFAAVLVLLALVERTSDRQRRALALGVTGGLAASTKLSFGLLPAVLLALARPNDIAGATVDRRSLAVGTIALAVTVLALNPFWLTATAQAARFVRASAGALSTTGWLPGSASVPGPLVYHSLLSLRFGCGLACAVLAGPALLYGLWEGAAARLVAIAVIGQCLALLSSPMVLARFFLPVVPGLAVLVGLLLARIVAGREMSPGRRTLALGLLVVVLTAEPLVHGVRLVRLLGERDTRSLAREWIAANLTARARLASWGAPAGAKDFGRPDCGTLPVFQSLPPERWQTEGITHLVWHHYPLPYSSEPLPVTAERLTSLAVFDPFDGPTQNPILEPLDAFYLPLAHFAGFARPGPRVEIFAVSP